MPGENITVYEKRRDMGGCCAVIGNEGAYICPGEQMCIRDRVVSFLFCPLRHAIKTGGLFPFGVFQQKGRVQWVRQSIEGRVFLAQVSLTTCAFPFTRMDACVQICTSIKSVFCGTISRKVIRCPNGLSAASFQF